MKLIQWANCQATCRRIPFSCCRRHRNTPRPREPTLREDEKTILLQCAKDRIAIGYDDKWHLFINLPLEELHGSPGWHG